MHYISFTSYSLSDTNPNIKGRGIAITLLDRFKQQHSAATLIDVVPGVLHISLTVALVGNQGKNLLAKGVIKEKLRGKGMGLGGIQGASQLEMNVDRPTLIPTGVNGGKLGFAIGICYLITPQKVLTHSVILPNV